jgi:uncharacterized RDD family membrane protein YckC
MELAERLTRLWAALIDRLIIVPVGVGAAILIPGLRHSSSLGLVVASCVLALLALVAAQIWLLTAHGQTIGKRIMGLRIVKVSDMTNGGFVTNVLLRGLLSLAITAVPFVGGLYALADVLFIFREDRRCLHDLIAGTCVIKAS